MHSTPCICQEGGETINKKLTCKSFFSPSLSILSLSLSHTLFLSLFEKIVRVQTLDIFCVHPYLAFPFTERRNHSNSIVFFSLLSFWPRDFLFQLTPPCKHEQEGRHQSLSAPDIHHIQRESRDYARTFASEKVERIMKKPILESVNANTSKYLILHTFCFNLQILCCEGEQENEIQPPQKKSFIE